MKNSTRSILDSYIVRNDFIRELEESIIDTFYVLNDCFHQGNKLLICGNGGSNSDADHIVGELLKGFTSKRSLSEEEKKLYEIYGDEGRNLAEKLQGSLPAINLGAHSSLITAVINDIGGEEIYAQQVMGYGNPGDVLLGISTSGNSRNIIKAFMVAKVKGIKTILLTGETGGKLNDFSDYCIHAPSNITCDIQDMHTTIYHILCAMIEAERWM